MRRLIPAMVLVVACGGTPSSDSSTVVTTGPESTPTEAGPDYLAAFQEANSGAPWIESVLAVTETEPGRLEVETDIVDPRGDPGSPEAETAILICEAAVAFAEVTNVSIFESDGTTFVVYGHPLYSNGCTEV